MDLSGSVTAYPKRVSGFGFRISCFGFRSQGLLSSSSSLSSLEMRQYRGTSLIRNSASLGPYSRPCLGTYGGPGEVGCFLSARYPCMAYLDASRSVLLYSMRVEDFGSGD